MYLINIFNLFFGGLRPRIYCFILLEQQSLGLIDCAPSSTMTIHPQVPRMTGSFFRVSIESSDSAFI
jgi:hypothetical protein